MKSKARGVNPIFFKLATPLAASIGVKVVQSKGQVYSKGQACYFKVRPIVIKGAVFGTVKFTLASFCTAPRRGENSILGEGHNQEQIIVGYGRHPLEPRLFKVNSHYFSFLCVCQFSTPPV